MTRLFIIFLLLGFSAVAQPQVSSKPTATQNEVHSMQKIRDDYTLFIDTRPSKKKNELAMRVKEEIETFEGRYNDSTALPAVLLLLKEVDIYLDDSE